MKSGFSFFRTLLSWVGILLWAAVLWKLSATSARDLNAPDFPFFDKIAHSVYFFAGGILIARPLYETFGLKGWRLVLCVLLIGCAVGASDEIHQLSTPGRSGADRGDFLADTIGAFFGGLAMAWSYGRQKLS